jgi:hypothetical protein
VVNPEFLMRGKLLNESPWEKNAFSPGWAQCLRLGAIKVAAGSVWVMKMRAALCTLKGDDLQRRSDPRPFSQSINLASCAVILYVVAVHAKAPWNP